MLSKKKLSNLHLITLDHQHFFDSLILILGGGFKYCLFSPLFGEDFQFD